MTDMRALNSFELTKKARTKSNIKVKKGIKGDLMGGKEPQGVYYLI